MILINTHITIKNKLYKNQNQFYFYIKIHPSKNYPGWMDRSPLSSETTVGEGTSNPAHLGIRIFDFGFLNPRSAIMKPLRGFKSR